MYIAHLYDLQEVKRSRKVERMIQIGVGGRTPRVIGRHDVSLRGPKPGVVPQITKLKNFRCPEPIDRYLRESSRALGRDQTDLIVGAIEMDRDLAAQLGPEVERLTSYAAQQGLDLDRDLAEVLARLVRLGLDATEPKKRGK